VSADVEREKRLAAEAAAALAEDGMIIGLGSGSTALLFVEALAKRRLDVRCVASSPATEEAARELGLYVESFAGADALPRLQLAVDGADQVARDGWLVKGAGGAHTREKVIASAADLFVVVISANKLVDRVGPPVPLELLDFGLASTLRGLGQATLRAAPRTPDGNLLADWTGEVGDPAALAGRLAATPGVVDHGLFPPELVTEVVVGRGDGVERYPSSG
jgi:ribose 5-phosphate isomerase A